MDTQQLPSDPQGKDTRTISSLLARRGLAGGVDLPGQVGELGERGTMHHAVGQEIARGGMGAIYTARDQNCRRTVAMKVILDDSAAKDEALLRFVEEAQITAQLEHPNIVPVHELGVADDGNVFYTMKMIHGVTLADIIQRLRDGDARAVAAYPLLHLVNIFLKACDAIAFAHSRGVVHRDLKPENIMVGDYGEVLVLDWGLAKIVGRESDVPAQTPADPNQSRPAWLLEDIESARQSEDGSYRTMDGAIMGTPTYMAPEQAYGKVNEIDARTDVYALGAILYTILTLHPPIKAETVHALLLKVAGGAIDNPQTHASDPLPHCPNGQLPAALTAVALEAMALEPVDRYPNVRVLQAEIEAWQGGFATAAEHAGPWRQLALWVKRHRREATISAIAAAVILVGFTVFVIGLNHQRQVAVAARNDAVAAREDLQAFGRQAGPEFVHRARRLIAGQQWEEAEQAARLAVGLDRESAAAWTALARVRLAGRRFTEAGEAFGQAARYATDEERAGLEAWQARTADWTAKLAADTGEGGRATLGEIADEVAAAGDAVVARAINTYVSDGNRDLSVRVQEVTQALREVNPGLDVGSGNVYVSSAGKVNVNIQNAPALTTIAPLAGLPILGLDIWGTGVSDISPAANPALRVVTITKTAVRSLEGLRDCQLDKLSCGATSIDDLSPLRGMPLHALYAGMSRVRDLSPLRGMPLTSLSIHDTTVVDLTPLDGMALEYIALGRCNITDISVLAGMPLEVAALESVPVADLAPLRGAPLVMLQVSGQPLGSAPFTALQLGHLEVFMAGCTNLDSLEFLRNSPDLKGLNVHMNTGLMDLGPLAGKPLADVNIDSTGVASLGPLAKAPLRVLSCRRTPIRRLEPVKDCPLEEISIDPDSIEDLDVLRGIPSLKTINGIPVAEFWRKRTAAGR